MNFSSLERIDNILFFKSIISVFYHQLNINNDCLETFKEARSFIYKLDKNIDSSLLLKLDFACISESNFLSNSELFNNYLDDYSKRYNEANRTMNHLQTSLTQKDNLYYTEILNTGSYDKKMKG